MTIKERAQVLYDFSCCLDKFSCCLDKEDCEGCAAHGVLCHIPDIRKARIAFFKETADVLMKRSKNE